MQGLLGIISKSSGFDWTVQHYNNITQTGSNPAVGVITLTTSVPVGESFAHITQKNDENGGLSNFAIAVLQTIVDGKYTECRIESIGSGGFHHRYSVQVVTSANFSVQQVLVENVTGDTLPRNETITAVDRNKTFVIHSWTGGDEPRSAFIQTQLTTDTNLLWRTQDHFASQTYSLCDYVVTMDIGAVDYGTTTDGSLITSSGFHEDETFVLFSYYPTTSSGDNMNTALTYGDWSAFDEYDFISGSDMEIAYYLVNIPNVSIQHLGDTFTGTGSDRIDTLTLPTSVDITKTFNAVPTMIGNALRSDTQSIRNALISHELSSTDVTFRWRSPDTTTDTTITTQIVSI